MSTLPTACELPIILYNVPSRTGVSFTAETYQVLAENPKINGVKEASGNFSLLAHTRYAVRRRLLHLVRQRRPGGAHDVPGRQGRHLGGRPTSSPRSW